MDGDDQEEIQQNFEQFLDENEQDRLAQERIRQYLYSSKKDKSSNDSAQETPKTKEELDEEAVFNSFSNNLINVVFAVLDNFYSFDLFQRLIAEKKRKRREMKREKEKEKRKENSKPREPSTIYAYGFPESTTLQNFVDLFSQYGAIKYYETGILLHDHFCKCIVLNCFKVLLLSKCIKLMMELLTVRYYFTTLILLLLSRPSNF